MVILDITILFVDVKGPECKYDVWDIQGHYLDSEDQLGGYHNKILEETTQNSNRKSWKGWKYIK